ncbi:ribosome hibernation-promoting factor, HPF/YfiA family [Microvirga sp. VF16]|uniref:ribosome hibernation-promoting factor, HPF/YfiA family n=1 Tax=Microvirga sp. VF16 TaxID=2807101 RepID=UPI00193DE44B|nr:ribosome-associated translation inhibitor RaiA [Microvirga sp. VF16]QRM33931.1 ribosome-associated translation inhibitor RaiA [Microvirga sp. VF16]
MKLKGVDRTILVQSSNIDLGDMLPDYARTSILQLASKYFGHLSAASVHFTREGATYRCTINVQVGTLKMMSGEAKSTDIYAAFRLALERVAKQLRRAKRALREDKAERLDKHLAWLGSMRRRSAGRHLEWPAHGGPVGIDHGGSHRMAAE